MPKPMTTDPSSSNASGTSCPATTAAPAAFGSKPSLDELAVLRSLIRLRSAALYCIELIESGCTLESKALDVENSISPFHYRIGGFQVHDRELVPPPF